MQWIDYTGKLNNHSDYRKVLIELEGKTKYIEIVILDGRLNNHIVRAFSKDILLRKKVSSWWGTKTNRVNNLYRIKASKALFTYLAGFETFCKYYFYGTTLKSLQMGDYVEWTDFGIDDIAFYADNNECLLCTTTHEGYVSVNQVLLK